MRRGAIPTDPRHGRIDGQIHYLFADGGDFLSGSARNDELAEDSCDGKDLLVLEVGLHDDYLRRSLHRKEVRRCLD